MYARSTTIQAQPSSIDDGIAHVRDEIMPALQDMAGCIGVSLLVDRQSGRCIATSAWETDEAMRLPSRKVVFVLTVVGVFMLVLAWLSSAQVTTPAPRGSIKAWPTTATR